MYSSISSRYCTVVEPPRGASNNPCKIGLVPCIDLTSALAWSTLALSDGNCRHRSLARLYARRYHARSIQTRIFWRERRKKGESIALSSAVWANDPSDFSSGGSEGRSAGLECFYKLLYNSRAESLSDTIHTCHIVTHSYTQLPKDVLYVVSLNIFLTKLKDSLWYLMY